MIFYRALSVGFCFVLLCVYVVCCVVVLLFCWGRKRILNFGAPVPYGYYVGTWYILFTVL